MRVAFRVDAGRTIGTGHVMRCLTLADALCARGAEVAFVSRPHEGHLLDDIERRGHPVHRLPPPDRITRDPATWLGAGPAADAAGTAHVLRRHGPFDWLVVDHYAIAADWEAEVAQHAGRLLVMDDLADRPHRCDVLLDPTYGARQEDYEPRVPAHCVLLLGPAHALLRPEFLEARRRRRPIDAVDSVFVFFGGTDRTDQCTAVLEALEPWRADIAVVVVAGAANEHIDGIRAAASRFRRARVLTQTDHMARLMAECDLAFGAGGVSTFERLAVGLPALVVTVAANQERVTGRLARDGYIELLGRDDEVTVEDWRERFAAVSVPDLRRRAERGMDLVDACGARRVVDQLSDVPPSISASVSS